MRTTLDIEDDVLAAAREIARRERKSAGDVVSRLLRQALTQPPIARASNARTAGRSASGFRAFASRGVPVTNAEIDRLRDAEGV
jgi:Arc/MetJ family transcription regulator